MNPVKSTKHARNQMLNPPISMRSVHLSRDYADGSSFRYLLSTSSQITADRIIKELVNPNGVRAWTITGPYGTGKSSFALFLSQVLAPNGAGSTASQKYRAKQKILKGHFLVVPVVGRREQLGSSLTNALVNVLSVALPRSRAKAKKKHNQHLNPAEVVQLYTQAASEAVENGFSGLLLIVDEFGKFLEYAAHHPEDEDIYIMQELAEAAARSKAPFALLTILHVGMEAYLPVMDRRRASEWKKVAGRFVDIPFMEPPEQVIRLIADAVEDMCGSCNPTTDEINPLLSSVDLEEAFHRAPALRQLLTRCLPLHPITAMVLPAFFRSEMAQNERSVFSFLTSGEPLAFRDFLASTSIGIASAEGSSTTLYTLADLYDYAIMSLGAGLLRGINSRRWSETDRAIGRIGPDAPQLASALVKAITILGMHGPSLGLRVSQTILAITLSESEEVTGSALQYLVSRSIVVYRKHEDAYALWEGSDVDLEALFDVQKQQVEGLDKVNLLHKSLTRRPFLARRHYFETGTLRAFDVTVIDGGQFENLNIMEDIRASGDGRIIFVIPTPSVTVRQLKNSVKIKTAISSENNEQRTYRPVIIAIPKEQEMLAEATLEVETWHRVLAHPTLQGDKVARSEASHRLFEARRRFLDVVGETFGEAGYVFRPNFSDWYYKGEKHALQTATEFYRWISGVSDELYYAAPKLLNELLNRNRLSTAAVKARNLLLKAMVANRNSYRLGIQQTPPEASMYEALLIKGGFHAKQADGEWDFQEPSSEWKSVWAEIQRFFCETRTGRKSVIELYDRLQKPPYGLRAGPLPVILLAAILEAGDRIAIYCDNGMFVPELREEVLEQFARNPDDFELREYPLNKAQKKLLAEINSVITQELENESLPTPDPLLLNAVRPLVKLAVQLPDYVKNTRTLSTNSYRLRDLLLRAKDPGELLFRDISNILSHEDTSAKRAAELQRILRELRTAYPALLDRIEMQIVDLFGLSSNNRIALAELQRRSRVVAKFATDRALRLFAQEVCRLQGGEDWREVIGRVVQHGKPPAKWIDQDAADFQVNLLRVKGEFVRLEELAGELGETDVGCDLLRVSMLCSGSEPKFREKREVLLVPPALKGQVDELVKSLELQLQTDYHSCKKSVISAALVQLLMKLNSTDQEVDDE